MSNMSNFLKDYIFSGMDDTGLTSNTSEIMKYLYGEDDTLDGFANETVKIGPYSEGKKSGRRFVLFQKEECRNRTKTGIEAAIFYAMRDSMKMTTVEFACMFNPTGLPLHPAGEKCGVLYCMDENVNTQLGNADLDHAMLLVATKPFCLTEDEYYAIEKGAWNIGRGEKVDYNYNNPAEINAKIMAQFMNSGAMKFHDFFPQYLHRVHDPNDPVNTSFEMKTLIEVYGDNLK